MTLPQSVQKLACLAALAIVAIPAAGQAAPSAQDAALSCRKFVREFYGWYVPLVHQRLQRAASTVAIERKPNVFAPALLQALKDDAEAQARASGDIVGIDFDPFVGGQDPADRYEARKVTVKGDRCEAEIWEKPTNGKWTPSAKPDVVAELSGSAGHWQFENFRYPDVNTDLLTTLAALRKERGEQR